MVMCLDCFMKTPPRNDYDFYDKVDLKYVKLTNFNMKCEVCGEEKPAIEHGIYWLVNPYGETAPKGYIDIQKLAESAENTPFSEENESGSINPQEGV